MNYLRGDTLIYTPKGLMRVDKLKKNDEIINGKGEIEKIELIEKNNITKKKIYKLKIYNTIDNFYICDKTYFNTLDNIPYELKYNEINKYIENNPLFGKIIKTNIKDLNDFCYISYPIIKFNDLDNDDNFDKYRFYGINLMNDFKNSIKISIDNLNTNSFINKYLFNNNITYDIIENKDYNIYNINNSISDLSLSLNILNLNKRNSMNVLKGIMEIFYNKNDNSNNIIINTHNKKIIYLIKQLLLKFNILPMISYNDNYILKIPKTGIINDIFDIKENNDIHNINNYFVYNDCLWIKIKKIKTEDELYSGLIYSIKTNNLNSISTDTGIIS